MMENLLDLVSKKGCEVDLLCTSNLKFVRKSSINLSQFWNSYLKVICKCINLLPFWISSYLNQKVFVRLFFRGIKKKYDFIDFHSIPPYTDRLIFQCIKSKLPYDVTFWGSDIINVSEKRSDELKILLDSCEHIKCTKNLYDLVEKLYGESYKSKYHETYFGNVGLDYLNRISEKEKEDLAIKLFGNIEDKIIVTCGYNGREVQDHELIINALNQLPNNIKKKLFVVFPMTYGKNESYYDKVRRMLKESSFCSIMLESFLDNYDLAALRFKTDIMIMAQKTDAFSGSVQEHLYCKNIVMIGEWLDYPLLKKSDIYYVDFTKTDLTEKLLEVLNNYNETKQLCVDNDKKLYSIVSWEARLNDWLPTYIS